jgi:DNA-binding transcriptional ArsR family regulator
MSEATGVNTAPPRAVMLSIGEIATRDGVSKPAVSRKVGQLVERHGLAVERDAQGRVARVNVAEYDHLRGRVDDPSKAQAPAAPIAPAVQTPGETYDEALRQRTWTEAERARLKLEEERRQLVRVAEVADAAALCAEDVIRVVKRLTNSVDDMANALAREGAHGLRTLMKTITDRQCTEIADAFERLASLARTPSDEGPGEGEMP